MIIEDKELETFKSRCDKRQDESIIVLQVDAVAPDTIDTGFALHGSIESLAAGLYECMKSDVALAMLILSVANIYKETMN